MDITALLRRAARQRHPACMGLYRYFHAHPELSHAERDTSARLAREFQTAGCKVIQRIGGYGLAGLMPNGAGPVILLRAEMDALPLAEKTGLPYASKRCGRDAAGKDVGVMHACGHDIHMTVLAGAAHALAALRQKWRGTLVFIGQPAEEKLDGARAMIAAGLFRRIPRPDRALSLHVTPNLPAGDVGICPGYAWAGTDKVTLIVRGVGGHGATPHATRDPIVLAAQIVLALQTVVSREIDPLEPALLSIGSIHGGTAFNIIPDAVELQLTVRSYAPGLRRTMLAAIRRIVAGLALSAGLPPRCRPAVIVDKGYTPAVYNDPRLTAAIAAAFRRQLGPRRVIVMKPEMFGEDFGFFGRSAPRFPLSIFRLGTAPPAQRAKGHAVELLAAPLHSSRYAPAADQAIATGVEALGAAVIALAPAD